MSSTFEVLCFVFVFVWTGLELNTQCMLAPNSQIILRFQAWVSLSKTYLECGIPADLSTCEIEWKNWYNHCTVTLFVWMLIYNYMMCSSPMRERLAKGRIQETCLCYVPNWLSKFLKKKYQSQCWIWWQTHAILTLRRQGQEEQHFKVSLTHTVGLRPDWATQDHIAKIKW